MLAADQRQRGARAAPALPPPRSRRSHPTPMPTELIYSINGGVASPNHPEPGPRPPCCPGSPCERSQAPRANDASQSSPGAPCWHGLCLGCAGAAQRMRTAAADRGAIPTRAYHGKRWRRQLHHHDCLLRLLGWVRRPDGGVRHVGEPEACRGPGYSGQRHAGQQ